MSDLCVLFCFVSFCIAAMHYNAFTYYLTNRPTNKTRGQAGTHNMIEEDLVQNSDLLIPTLDSFLYRF